MKIYTEKSLVLFEFWGGACYTANSLTMEELQRVEDILEEIYPEGVDETTINDIFWFESDTIAGWLGYENWEALEAEKLAED